MRFALFGDVGGHYGPFAAALEALGVDLVRAQVPPGLVVVQLGDLIDRGPASAACVALADRFLSTAPDQWIQLFGNHEGNRLGGPRFWDEALDAEAVKTLLRWWDERRARMAVALRSQTEGELLVTHGGVVSSLWQVLGRPSAVRTASALNAWVGTDARLAFAPGALLGAGGIAGPAWPDAGTELYGSWANAGAVPFGQVHGHSSIADWERGKMRRQAPRWLRAATVLDTERRHERVTIGDRPFIGIDPVLGSRTRVEVMRPLLLDGDELV